MSEDFIANYNEAVDEMKETASLSDLLRNRTKFAEDTITTYIDYEAALKVIDLQDKVEYLNTLIEEESQKKGTHSITEDPVGELREEREAVVVELQEALNTAQASKVEWTVRGVPPKVWRAVDKSARQKFPLTQEADEHTKVEVQLKRNDFVNAETLKTGTVKIVFGSGEVFNSITSEEAQQMWDNLPMEVTLPVKDRIDELTFANQGFQEYLESADFLSKS